MKIAVLCIALIVVMSCGLSYAQKTYERDEKEWEGWFKKARPTDILPEMDPINYPEQEEDEEEQDDQRFRPLPWWTDVLNLDSSSYALRNTSE